MWFDILLKERITDEKFRELEAEQAKRDPNMNRSQYRRDEHLTPIAQNTKKFRNLENYTKILLNYLMRPSYEHDIPHKRLQYHSWKEIWGDFDINNPMTWKKSAEYYDVDLDDAETQEYIMNSFAAKGFE